jgi:DNA-directed RNA polymerase specialized sigma24 family protein
LHYLLDLDVATTAAVLEVSPGTVKTALSRAREKLAAALRERESDRT